MIKTGRAPLYKQSLFYLKGIQWNESHFSHVAYSAACIEPISWASPQKYHRLGEISSFSTLTNQYIERVYTKFLFRSSKDF